MGNPTTLSVFCKLLVNNGYLLTTDLSCVITSFSLPMYLHSNSSPPSQQDAPPFLSTLPFSFSKVGRVLHFFGFFLLTVFLTPFQHRSIFFFREGSSPSAHVTPPPPPPPPCGFCASATSTPPPLPPSCFAWQFMSP